MSDVQSLITDNIDVWTSAIKKRSTTGRGSNKKLELKGIKKLRELILEFAIQGKLIPQDPNDEPASILLEKITSEKNRSINEKKLKNQKLLPTVGDDEKSFKLPIGWEWTRLGNICEIAPRNNLDDNIDVSFIPMPLITTSYKGIHGQDIKKWAEIKKGYTHFTNGDIGLAKITPCFENSKAVVFSGLNNGYGAGTTELHIARPYGKTIDQLFILLYLKAPQFLLVGETKMTGTAGQKRVPKDFFAKNPLPFPPLAEQHRIVAKVDELMSLCDRLEQQTEDSIAAHQTLVETLLGTLTDSASTEEFNENWTRIAEHFDTLFTTEESIEQLKQTILQLAVMGKLVPQDPDDEHASVLLEKIAVEKDRLIKEKKIKKQKTLSAIEDAEKPFDLPDSWVWTRLGMLFKSFSNGLYKPAKFYSDSGIISLRMYNIQSGKINFSGVRRVELNQNELEQFSLEENDLLINRVNSKELVGKTAIIPPLQEPLVFESMNMRAKPFTNHISAHYINLLMMSQCTKSVISSMAKEAIGQASINQGQVSSINTPLPPLSEQFRIVAKVDELMALCDQIKSHISDAQSTQLHLADAMVEQACK